MKLQKYQITNLIGKGGMGQVFSAIDETTGQSCAIKEIYVDDDLDKLKRFEKEYNILSMINHPNIVKAYDFFCENNKFYIAMELVNGISLEEFIQQEKKLSLKDKIAIAIQIVNALEAINFAGIIHRDIKPANIMIDNNKKQIKILDLGLAKSNSSEVKDKLTQTGFIMGTPQYISPEQINGKLYENSDVFSVAVTLYQFFLGSESSPFAQDSLTGTIYNIGNKNLPLLMHSIADIKPSERKSYQSLSLIIDKALLKSPQKRTKSCKILAIQLSKVYYQLRSKRLHSESWRASSSLDKRTVIGLRRLSKKYGNDFNDCFHNRKAVSKNIIIVLTIILGIICCIPFLMTTNSNSQNNTIEENLQTTKIEHDNNLYSLVSKALLLAQQKKYADSAFVLSCLDKNKINYVDETDELAYFISLFYQEKWDKAMVLVPQLLRDQENPIAWFYAIRLFICMGESSLAQWYGNILQFEYPDFCKHLQHPAIDIATANFFEAYYKYKMWDIRTIQNEEVCINEAFLRTLMLQRLAKKGNWTTTTTFVKKYIKSESFGYFYNFTSMDFGLAFFSPFPNEQGRFHLQQYENVMMSNSHYLKHRIVTLLFPQKNYSNTINILSKYSEDYPLYSASFLLIGNLNALNSLEQYNSIPGNKSELNGVLYHCTSGSLQQKKEMRSESLQYGKLLLKYRPNWHFSYTFYGEALTLYENYNGALNLICKGIKVNAPKIIWSEWFKRNKEDILNIFSNLPDNKQIEIIIDLQWYLFEMGNILNLPKIQKIDRFPELEDIYRHIVGFHNLLSAKQTALLKESLLIDNFVLDEAETICKFAILQKNNIVVEKCLSKIKLPMIQATLLLNSLPSSPEINQLEEINLLLQDYKQINQNKDYPYDILYCLQSFRLAMKYESIEKYGKAIEIIENECHSGDLSIAREAERLKREHLKIDPFTPSIYLPEDCIKVIQKNISDENYNEAQKNINYTNFLLSLLANGEDYQQQLQEISLLVSDARQK